MALGTSSGCGCDRELHRYRRARALVGADRSSKRFPEDYGMISDKAKAAILDKCCQKVDCLARGEVIDLEGAPDLHQSTSPESSTLKPCPFCGTEAMLVCEGDFVTVACPHYYCNFSQIALQNKGKAIARWNARTSDLAQYSQEQVRNIVHHQISGHLHPETAKQISEIVANQIVALTDTSTVGKCKTTVGVVDIAPAALTITEPWSMEEALTDEAAAKVDAALSDSSPDRVSK
jgi:hypothetical protein